MTYCVGLGLLEPDWNMVREREGGRQGGGGGGGRGREGGGEGGREGGSDVLRWSGTAGA